MTNHGLPIGQSSLQSSIFNWVSNLATAFDSASTEFSRVETSGRFSEYDISVSDEEHDDIILEEYQHKIARDLEWVGRIERASDNWESGMSDSCILVTGGWIYTHSSVVKWSPTYDQHWVFPDRRHTADATCIGYRNAREIKLQRYNLGGT